MDLGGAVALAQADDQHLEDARLVGPAEVGVRLDPVEQDDPVGRVGVPVEVDRQADGVGPEDHGVHLGPDLDAHRLGGDPVAGQQLALAFGRRAAVAPHRGDDEGLEAHLLQGVDRRRATVGIAVIPRLPTPTAIVPPAGTRSRSRLSRIRRRTVPAMSATRGWGIDCLTRATWK